MSRVGDRALRHIYVGNRQVRQSYAGQTLVFREAPLPRPCLDGRKMLAGLNKEDGRYTEVKALTIRLSGAPASYVRTWDVSEYGTDRVNAYLTEGGELVLSGNGNGRLIPDPWFEFYNFTNLEVISGWENIDGSDRPRIMNFFRNCASLKALPPGVFAGWGTADTSGVARSAEFVCYGCTSLEALPADMFAGAVFSDFDYGFTGCTKLTTLPPTLFSERTRLKEMRFTFQNSGVTAVPDRFLAGATQLYDVLGMFEDCTSLVTVGEDVFSGVESMRYCSSLFEGCSGITSAVPRLWEQWASAEYKSSVFRGCVNAANYSEIPLGWRN